MVERGRKTGTDLTRAERGERTRARLIEATIVSIARDGVSGASITRITAIAGVSQGLVRHYFGSKRQLIAEAFSQLADEFRDFLGMRIDQPSGSLSAREQLIDIAVRTFDDLGGVHDRQYAWFGFWALARSDENLTAINRQLQSDIVEFLGSLASDAAAERGLSIDANAAGRELAAVLDGSWLHFTVGSEDYTRREAERICLAYVTWLLGPMGDQGKGST